jgi:hypothetical protein
MRVRVRECSICEEPARKDLTLSELREVKISEKETGMGFFTIYLCEDCHDDCQRIKEIRERRLEKRKQREQKPKKCGICEKDAIEECWSADYQYLCRRCFDRLMDEGIEEIEEIQEEEEEEEEKYNPDLDSNLIKIGVKSLPEKWLKKIPEEHHDKEVYIVVDRSRKETGKELVDILNERFQRKQLGLNNRMANNRDLYYQILTRLGEIDLKGDSLQQQISLDGAVRSYCEKLQEFFNAPYWGYIQDELEFVATARTTAYSIEGKSYKMDQNMMSNEYFGKDKNEFYDLIRKTPFFFIVCEKELVVMETMEALRDLGYTEGWLGFNTQGYASTNLIRTLIEYRDTISNKFCVFSLHDYDVEGIKIFLDMKRYFNVESAGLNPELMRRCGIDFTGKGQKYRGASGEAKSATLKGAATIIDGLFENGIINTDEKEEYEEWVDGCSKERYELQSITGVRLDEDMDQNPARDYAEYIQYKLESMDRKWDINRLKEPKAIGPDTYEFKIEVPSFISEIIEDLQEKISDTINDYLDTKNLKTVDDWKELLLEKYGSIEKHEYNETLLKTLRKIQGIYGNIKAIRIRKKNKRYTESLKGVKKVVDKQSRELWNLHYSQNKVLRKKRGRLIRLRERLFKKMPEYQKVRATLEKLQKQITETLDKIEFEEEE